MRECFPLVSPISNENDLQRLYQILIKNFQNKFDQASHKEGFAFQVKAALFCNCIAGLWKLRNQVVFSEEPVNLHSFCTVIAQQFNLRLQLRGKNLNMTTTTVVQALARI